MTDADKLLQIEVWSDIICPWCYIGNVRLKKAIALLDDPDSVSVRTRSFELDELAAHDPAPNLERLAAKYGVSMAEAKAMEQRVVDIAVSEGMPFSVDRPSRNSFDLHRMVWLAREFDLGEQLFDRLQASFFGEGTDVFDHEVMAAQAQDVGVPLDRAVELLASNEYSDEVRADESQARAIGVTGVPFAVLAGRWAIPGAVGVDQYLAALKEILSQGEEVRET